MKFQLKMLLTACLFVLTLLFVSGCAGETTPYDENDSQNYKVSVKYDANGGFFTTNTSVIMDSYNISDLKADGAGKVQIALLSPDSELRRNDAYSATNIGYFLAGWYAQRNESVDENGKTIYTYADKWDFDTDVLSVAADGKYSSSEPVLTLYAAWVPLFNIEFYDLDTGELRESISYNPTEDDELIVPAWDKETGTIDMFDFPERDGYTFNGVFLDESATLPVEGEKLAHTGSVNLDTAESEGGTMKLYVDWMEGEWYHIYTAKQFSSNASINGSYIIHEDLDFTDVIWPTSLMYGNFNGTIQGNGHAFKNIQLTQTNNSKVNAGLFGSMTDQAQIQDLTFDNVTFTMEAGTRVAGASFGLLAGTISEGAQLENVAVSNSTLQISSKCYFGSDDYVIGLICGMGDYSTVTSTNLQCIATGDNPEKLQITVDDNAVNVVLVSE